MSKINIGIFGCGGAAFCIHLPVLLRLSDLFRINSIYDVDRERSCLASEGISDCVVCSEPKEIFRDKNIDMVVILSPNHENLINDALDAGKHVFTEKPISLDIEHSRLLVKKAKNLKLILEVGLMRFHDIAIKSFFNQVSCREIVSGFFYKADGSDKVIREAVMPKKLEAYNFSQAETPLVPLNLTEQKLKVLKKLLWSGIHLITVLCSYFPELKVIFCKMSDSDKSVSCLLVTKDDKQFLLNISETEVESYNEGIQFIGQSTIGSLEFSSPYLLDNYTKVKIETNNSIEIVSDNQSNYKSSFVTMWENIFTNVSSGKQSNSAELALRVEQIARDAAEIC